MNNNISSYILCMSFMLIILGMLTFRAHSAIREKSGRVRCCVLIGVTALYVILDAAFIACHLSQSSNLTRWAIVAFVFYILYVIMPVAWYMFVRRYVGYEFRFFHSKIQYLPLIALLVMVAVTPFTGYLWSFGADGMYVRGPGYLVFSWLNYFYYVAPIVCMIAISLMRKKQKETYALQTIGISLVPLAGAVVNGTVIPAGTIFPFQPFCSVVVALLAFFFIATKDSDALKDQQQLAVQDALEKAETASRIKTKFLSDMSHDIRTPMNAILNFIDLALDEKDIEKVHGYLNKTKLAGKFLLGLINDILDTSRIESGELVLHKENLTRTEFLNTIETIIVPMMERKNINFHSELNPGEYVIGVDKLRFNQIFFNLLSNAAKYTPEGGDVWFEVHNIESDGKKLKVRFVVRDNGVGMSEEFLQNHIFKPFSREETEANIRTEGTGLGLSIVKRLVDAMDGTITVNSKLGEGTEIIVEFYADIISRDDNVVSAEKTAEHEIDGLHIMLVEDNELNTCVASLLLEKAGCIVTTAENGKKALEIFTAQAPFTFDAILMDLRMPVMGGIEATKAIRASGRLDAESVPVIAMTADVFEDERKSIFDAGMNYYLPKPISADELYTTLKKVCSPATPPGKKWKRDSSHRG